MLCDNKCMASHQHNAGHIHTIKIANKMGCNAITGKWFLLQDKAWPHEPYSSDLSPSDFFSFLWLKQALKGHHYADIQASHMAGTKLLCNIPECFPQLLQTSINAGSSVLTQEEVILKAVLSTRAQVHHTHFYTVSLKTLQTKAVFGQNNKSKLHASRN